MSVYTGKLCKHCGQSILKKGQKRKHPDDYRHAQGCPLARGNYYVRLDKLGNRLKSLTFYVGAKEFGK